MTRRDEGWPWRVVVLAHPRSGSNSLVEILQRQPSVSIVNEPFNEHFATWDPHNPDYVARLRSGEAFDGLLDELFAEFTGVKVLSYQLGDGALGSLLARPEVKVVALRRRNLLQTAVSQVVAESTGLWKTWDADRDLEDYYRELPPLDLETVASRLAWSRDEAERVEAAVAELAPERVLRLVYEDLYEAEPADARTIVADVWSFLDLEPVDDPAIEHFLSDAVRQARPSTYGRIPNLGEVEAVLGNDADGHLPAWMTDVTDRARSTRRGGATGGRFAGA